VLDRKVDDLADFMLVDAALDSGHERHVQANFGKSVKARSFCPGCQAHRAECGRFPSQAIELEVKRWPDLL